MKTYRVTLCASKAGSIGSKYNIRCTYCIAVPYTYDHLPTTEADACYRDDANEMARRLAYADGLEHVLITSTKPL